MTEAVIWGFKQDYTKNRYQLGFRYNICQVCDEYHLTALEYYEESDDDEEEEEDRYECVQCSAMLPKGLIGFCDMECRSTYAKEYRPISVFKK
jgi:lysyl-tRNA synthetase class I